MRVLAAVAFADPEKYAGKVIPVAREAISWPQVADILTEVTGTKVRRASMPAARMTVADMDAFLSDHSDLLRCEAPPTICGTTVALHRSQPCNAPQHQASSPAVSQCMGTQAVLPRLHPMEYYSVVAALPRGCTLAYLQNAVHLTLQQVKGPGFLQLRSAHSARAQVCADI